MKRILIFSFITFFLYAGMRAQSVGIDEVLHRIEANNKELQANAQLITSQKLENKSENNLPDPTLSYAHLWGSEDKSETIGELVVSQSFDFPTLYATRGKVNRLKTGALDAQSAAFRQQLLLQAKELCFDIIMLQHQQVILDERMKQAEELSAYYKKRLETGDANVLETNKINLELLNVRTEFRANQTALDNAWKSLLALNGDQSLQDNELSSFRSINDYPLPLLPNNYEQLRSDHLFERHACAVVDFTFRRAELQKFRVDQASGIDDAAGLLQQTRTAHRDEIDRAAPGADKMYHSDLLRNSLQQRPCVRCFAQSAVFFGKNDRAHLHPAAFARELLPDAAGKALQKCVAELFLL